MEKIEKIEIKAEVVKEMYEKLMASKRIVEQTASCLWNYPKESDEKMYAEELANIVAYDLQEVCDYIENYFE